MNVFWIVLIKTTFECIITKNGYCWRKGGRNMVIEEGSEGN